MSKTCCTLHNHAADRIEREEMNLTKDQIEKLCEGFDVRDFCNEHRYEPNIKFAEIAFAMGRQYQAKNDAELCRKLCEKYFDHAKRPYEKCADAIERSIEGK